jgi:large subunit ribosomal protein L21e
VLLRAAPRRPRRALCAAAALLPTPTAPSPRAQIRNRIIKKRVNIRVEHVHPSKCRGDFLARVKKNETVKREAKAKGLRVPIEMLKRYPGTPLPGALVKAQNAAGSVPTLIAPLSFDEMI